MTGYDRILEAKSRVQRVYSLAKLPIGRDLRFTMNTMGGAWYYAQLAAHHRAKEEFDHNWALFEEQYAQFCRGWGPTPTSALEAILDTREHD